MPLKRGGVGGRCSERRGSAMRRPGVDRRGRGEAEKRRSTKHGEAWDKADARLCKNEWMAATATERRLRGPPGQVSTRGRGSATPTPSSVCARSASSGSAMSIREPRLTPCACSCRQFFEYELGASGSAMVARISALPLRNQWLSRNLCDTFALRRFPCLLAIF